MAATQKPLQEKINLGASPLSLLFRRDNLQQNKNHANRHFFFVAPSAASVIILSHDRAFHASRACLECAPTLSAHGTPTHMSSGIWSTKAKWLLAV